MSWDRKLYFWIENCMLGPTMTPVYSQGPGGRRFYVGSSDLPPPRSSPGVGGHNILATTLTGERRSRTRRPRSLADIVVLAGAAGYGRMTPPASTTISGTKRMNNNIIILFFLSSSFLFINVEGGGRGSGSLLMKHYNGIRIVHIYYTH